jgi:hypothetical protein
VRLIVQKNRVAKIGLSENKFIGRGELTISVETIKEYDSS